MNYLKTIILILLISACNSVGAIKIVCIGNSISQGRSTYLSGTDYANLKYKSYRYYLWEKLDSAGLEVDFVGYNPYYFEESKDLNTLSFKIFPPVSQYTGHTFPRYHECYWGINTISFLAGINSSSGGHPIVPNFDERLLAYDAPDIALIHLGTNADKDDNGNAVTQITIDNLKLIIDKLRVRNPNIKILLAKLITNWSAVNSSIPTIVSQKNTKESPVIMVDQTVGFVNDPNNKSTDTWDWVHPNDKGNKKIAQKWYDAIMALQNATSTQAIGVNRISIHPNPATHYLEISISENATAEIFNALGASILKATVISPVTHLSISHLATGNYFIHIKNDKTNFTEKLVVK